MILRYNDFFNLKLGNTNKVITNASVIASDNEIAIYGGAEKPEINNDMSHTNSVANSKNNAIQENYFEYTGVSLNNSNFSNDPVQMYDPSSIYLDENYISYTLSVLEKAVDLYEFCINNNYSEAEALSEAAKFLMEDQHLDNNTAEKLIEFEKIKNNPEFMKILKKLSSSRLMKNTRM